MLNGHGDDIYGHGRIIASNFSSNVYNRLDLTALRTHLQKSLQVIHSYPEPTGRTLVHALAYKNEIADETICLTNGATEAIYTIAHAYRGIKGAIVIPTFSEYEDACCINDIELQFIRSIYEADESTELLWICNPNNPTGGVVPKEKLISFAKAHPYITLVVDQSYGYFTQEPMITPAEAIACKNMILLQSMTKQFAIPGLRLGYAIAHEEIIEKLNQFRMPWSVNALALSAGEFLLNNDLSTQLDMETYLQETKRFAQAMQATKIMDVEPTSTHFFLCKLKKGFAANLKDYLVENYGFLIRDASNFRGLNDSYFRVATQSREENDELVKAIDKWEIR